LTFFFIYSSAIQLLRFILFHRRLHLRWRRSTCSPSDPSQSLSPTTRFDRPGTLLTLNRCAPHLENQTCLHTTARHIAGPLLR